VKNKLLNIPPIPAVILAIISVLEVAAIAKELFPAIGAAGTGSLRIGVSAIILLAIYGPNLFKITTNQRKYVIPYSLSLGAIKRSLSGRSLCSVRLFQSPDGYRGLFHSHFTVLKKQQLGNRVH